jgi:hypothetical protein
MGTLMAMYIGPFTLDKRVSSVPKADQRSIRMTGSRNWVRTHIGLETTVRKLLTRSLVVNPENNVQVGDLERTS